MSPRCLILAAVLAVLPVAAQAESEECRATCEAYRDCAGGALQAIYDGMFSGAECGDYESCQAVVFQCRARAGACQNECEDGVGS